jgi:hypothetical protein
MPLRPVDRNEAKLAAWSLKHDMSQNEILNLILDSVNDVIIEELVVEVRNIHPLPKRALKIKKIATWG